jgi:hypothetical protein
MNSWYHLTIPIDAYMRRIQEVEIGEDLKQI